MSEELERSLYVKHIKNIQSLKSILKRTLKSGELNDEEKEACNKAIETAQKIEIIENNNRMKQVILGCQKL